MCHGCVIHNKIRCLRIIYNNSKRVFRRFVNEKWICHHIHKVYKNISTELMKGLSCVRQINYYLRNPHQFGITSMNSVYHGSESILNLGPRIWNLVPERIK